MTNKNIRLRASSSERWINCPGSAQLEHAIPEIPSKYAEEGIMAHDVAATMLNYFKDKKQLEIFINVCNYSAYVHGLLIAANDNDRGKFFLVYDTKTFFEKDKLVLIEHKVDFSHVMPGAYDATGTCDALIFDDAAKTLHIIDLKYGKGIKVEVENNTQLLLYAIGAINDFQFLYDIHNIRLHIVQPRMDNYQSQHLTIDELEPWHSFFIEKSQLALSENAPRIPDVKICRFCRAKSICPEYQEFTKPFSIAEFDDLTLTTTNQEN